jgi:spermidine/putrescine transport system substrate-binding protein
MKWTKVLFMVVTSMLVVGMLAGCTSSKEDKQVLNLYTWADNFDQDLIKEFEEKYNVKVNQDAFDSNETMYAKIQSGASYDLIQPSDYMVEIMIQQGMLEKLDRANIPNLDKVNMTIKDTPYDPKGEYSVIYMYGITGIAYNEKHVKTAPTGWKDLWNADYKDHVALLKDSREALGMSLIKNGYSNNTEDANELKTAAEDLKKLKVMTNPLVDTDTIKDKFMSEDAWIGTLWSGDAVFTQKENKDVKYMIPKEGATIFADTFAIPKNSKNKELAEKFINFMLEEDVSVRNYEYTGYINPDENAFAKHSEEYKNNEVIKYVRENLKTLDVRWIKDLGKTTEEYSRYWDEFGAAK